MSKSSSGARNGASANGHAAPVEFLALDDKLLEEMQRLAEVNNELLGKSRPDSAERRLGSALARAEAPPPRDEDHALLRTEIAKLRDRLDDAEKLLEQAAASEEKWLERQKEYESLLDEKTEVIRQLHLKIKEVEAGASSGATAKAAENAAILKIKAELAEQRQQLEQDEESLMQQMRQMELAMSRDRAELARQRNELQRLQAELNHEIETASRESGLRERLQSLQRRSQESMAKKGGAAPAAAAANAPLPAAAAASDHQKKSGFLGRLFGK